MCELWLHLFPLAGGILLPLRVQPFPRRQDHCCSSSSTAGFMKSARIKTTSHSYCSSLAGTSLEFKGGSKGEIFPFLQTSSAIKLLQLWLHQQLTSAWLCSQPAWGTGQMGQGSLCAEGSPPCSSFRWAHSPSALSAYSQFHALNISQKFKVTEPEVLQSGTLNFSKLVRILECACSLFSCSTSFPYMLLSAAVQDTY